MALFFDSVPTNQSRLITFRCPNYKESETDKEHFITIVWKAKKTQSDEEILLLVENIRYRGKPIALKPDSIEGYKGETFPLGTLYCTCTCMPKKSGKVCYIASEVTEASSQTNKTPGEKSGLLVTKKISQDIHASTKLLIQLYDGMEDIVAAQKISQDMFLQKMNLMQSRLDKIDKSLDNLNSAWDQKFRALTIKTDSISSCLHLLLATIHQFEQKVTPVVAGISEEQKILTETNQVVESTPVVTNSLFNTIEQCTTGTKEDSSTTIAQEFPAQVKEPSAQVKEQIEPSVQVKEEKQYAVYMQPDEGYPHLEGSPQFEEYLQKLRQAKNTLGSIYQAETIEESEEMEHISNVLDKQENLDTELGKVLEENEQEETTPPSKHHPTSVTQVIEAAILRANVAKFKPTKKPDTENNKDNKDNKDDKDDIKNTDQSI